MVDHIFTQTREEAVGVGQMLLNHGALHHASTPGAPFADGKHLFQFAVYPSPPTSRARELLLTIARTVVQRPETYAKNKSGFLGLKHHFASPYVLRFSNAYSSSPDAVSNAHTRQQMVLPQEQRFLLVR
jgi:hypothetical protein